METTKNLFIPLQRSDFQPFDVTYNLGDEFFQNLEDAEVEAGDVKAEVKVSKIGDAFMLDFAVEGDVKVPCDRCLGLVDIYVENEGSVKVLFGDVETNDDEDWIVLDDREDGVDVTWLIYEVIALGLPMQRLHEEGECDEEMLSILEKYTSNRVPEEKNEDEIDPRWEALKNLNKEN